jgi:hypothetical protein
VQDRSPFVAGDQRESKRRGGQDFFNSWRPKRIKEERRTGFFSSWRPKRIKKEGRTVLL